MGTLLLHVLPIAVAIALEPHCVLAALMMAATDRSLTDSFAHLGALAGVRLDTAPSSSCLWAAHAAGAAFQQGDFLPIGYARG